jgi:hypothetical protein
MSIGKEKLAAPSKAKSGRPRRWHENMQARFEEGTLARLDEVLREGETKVDFVNKAVIREIARREERN